MRVLLAEDDTASRRIIHVNLEQWGYDVVDVANGQQALNVLDGPGAPTLAVLDWLMPEIDGIEVCRRVREFSREPYTYIILLTSKGQKEDIVEGLECGADDYVVKPFNPHELRVRLRAGERIVVLQQQLIAARERMRDLATKDMLTGLFNRAAILEELTKQRSRAARSGSPFHLCMLDLDHFKAVNDTYGHGAGDDTLKESAACILSALRDYDAAGRYGGEEFLVVLVGGDFTVAGRVADRIRERISALSMSVDDRSYGITASIGMVTIERPPMPSVELILKAADEALYAAKREGRNRTVHVRMDELPVSMAT
jgi:two-component system cell cycle response regulator